MQGPRWIAGLSLAGALVTAAAQSLPEPSSTAYRCGPDGRSYSDSPCPQGRSVAADDSRSAAQQREAREVAQRERQLANRMTAERRQREKAVPAAAVSLGPTAKASAPATGKKAKKGSKKDGTTKKRKPPNDPTMSDPILTPPKR